MKRGENKAGAMTAEQFRSWRKALGWKQKEAAEHLGLKKRMIQYYEKGDRNGKAVEIPKSVRLACFALAQGVSDFDGSIAVVVPPTGDAEAGPEPRAARKKASEAAPA